MIAFALKKSLIKIKILLILKICEGILKSKKSFKMYLKFTNSKFLSYKTVSFQIDI